MKLLVRGVCVLALLALAMWFTDAKPRLVGKLRHPLISHGRIGAVTDTRVFSVKVTRVDVASVLVKAGLASSKRMSTPAIFVIVSVDAKSNSEPVDLGRMRLRTRDGLVYTESGRLGAGDFGSKPFEPMLWQPARYVFEIPKDRLAGARFIAGEARFLNSLSAEAEIDLGIDDGKAGRMLAHPGEYVLRSS